MPVTATATSTPSRRRAPSAIATATCAETAPWASSTAGGTSASVGLHRVRVRDEAAEEVRARAGDLGDQVRDEPAGAGLGGGERRDRGTAGGPDPLSEVQQVLVRRWTFVAARPSATLGHLGLGGRLEEPRLGCAAAAQRAKRRPVERELRHARRAGADLDGLLGVERQLLAVAVDAARRPRCPDGSCRRPRP